MKHNALQSLTHISGVFFAAMLIACTLLLAGCNGNTPDDTVKAKADRALDNFVKSKFTKLTTSEFKTIATKRLPDDSWEFTYESTPRPDLPRFRLFLTITPDGRELWKGQKENDPSKPPVGAEAQKQRLKK